LAPELLHFDRMRRKLALAFTLTLGAQELRFDVDSRLVMIPVTVTDNKGRPIDGLEAGDFRVFDDGRPQDMVVDTIGTGVAPIALVIAVQSSGISEPALAKVRKTASLIGPLVTGERGCAALLSFDETVTWLQECTSDQDALTNAFHRLRAGEYKSARMLDAVHDGVRRLRKYPNSRRVLLVISESRDRGSESDLESVVRAAESAGVTIYAAPYSAFKTAFTAKPADSSTPPPPDGPGAQRSPPPNPPAAPSPANFPVHPVPYGVDIIGAVGELARMSGTKTTDVLTTRTGGAAFPFARQKGLEQAIGKLGEELHTQYVLSFMPEGPVPGYHRLEVRINRTGEFRVRARPGYWAVQASR
jgi:VWFA-related protein